MYILNKMAIKIITRLCIALRCNTEGQYLRLQHIACFALYLLACSALHFGPPAINKLHEFLHLKFA